MKNTVIVLTATTIIILLVVVLLYYKSKKKEKPYKVNRGLAFSPEANAAYDYLEKIMNDPNKKKYYDSGRDSDYIPDEEYMRWFSSTLIGTQNPFYDERYKNLSKAEYESYQPKKKNINQDQKKTNPTNQSSESYWLDTLSRADMIIN